MVLNDRAQMKMIEQALKDQAPRMHQQLKASGKLRKFLEDRAQMMEDSFLLAVETQLNKRVFGKNLSHEQEIQDQTMINAEAWHDTLATYLEFADTEEQQEEYIKNNPEFQRRLKLSHQEWMKGVEPESQEEMECFWEAEQKQEAINWILEQMEDEEYKSHMSRDLQEMPPSHLNKSFEVLVDDNYDYMNKELRYKAGSFDSYDEAVIAAKAIVDECLEQYYEPGMTAEALYQAYTGGGDDPFIVGDLGKDVLEETLATAKAIIEEMEVRRQIHGDNFTEMIKPISLPISKVRFCAWDYAKERCKEICKNEDEAAAA